MLMSDGIAASNKGRLGKTSYFRAKCVNISETVGDMSKVTIMTNRKAYIGFQSRWPWMTLNCYNFEFSSNFARFCTFGRQ